MPFLVQTLDAFNHGKLDTETATQLLSVSRAHLFRLRALWLRHPTTFALQLSGGNHHPAWPEEVRQFLAAFLPLQRPPNYQLVADELADRFGFERDRKSVAAYARTHFPLLVNAPAPIPKPRRRWQRARVGELWQHDSSIHQWWPASDKQTLLLRVDDHSRKLVERSRYAAEKTGLLRLRASHAGGLVSHWPLAGMPSGCRRFAVH